MGYDFSNGFHAGYSGRGRICDFLLRYCEQEYLTDRVLHFVNACGWAGFSAEADDASDIHAACLNASAVFTEERDTQSSGREGDLLSATNSVVKHLARCIESDNFRPFDIW